MKRIRTQLLWHFCIFWIAGMLLAYLLFHFLAGPIGLWRSKATLQGAWQTLRTLEAENFLASSEEDEEILEDIEAKVNFVVYDPVSRSVLYGKASRNKSAQDYAYLFRESALFSREPIPVYEKNVHGDPVTLRGCSGSAATPLYFYLYKNTYVLTRTLRQADKILLAGLLVATVFGLILLHFVSMWNLRELERVSHLLPDKHTDTYGKLLPVSHSRNEISQIARYINQLTQKTYRQEAMLANYRYLAEKDARDPAQLDQLQKDMISEVTHHLKTPLAIISSQLELDHAETDPAKKEYYYDSILEEIDKMSLLISDFLHAKRLPASAGQPLLRRTCISVVLSDLSNKYKDWLTSRLFFFDAYIAPDIYCLADSSRIEQAIHNYMLNAISHTRTGKHIRLSLVCTERFCTINVYNEGDGISQVDSARIWTRRYQTDSASGTAPNAGIGLYIVKRITEEHGGSCGMENEPAGVSFWIRLPLYQAAQSTL